MLKLKDPSLLKSQCYVDGKWIGADSGETIAVDNPATGEKITSIPKLGTAETRRAIEAADQQQVVHDEETHAATGGRAVAAPAIDEQLDQEEVPRRGGLGGERRGEQVVQPGDAVWIEDPGYSGAVDAFRNAKAKIVPVRVDDDGLDPAHGRRGCARPVAVYLIKAGKSTDYTVLRPPSSLVKAA